MMPDFLSFNKILLASFFFSSFRYLISFYPLGNNWLYFLLLSTGCSHRCKKLMLLLFLWLPWEKQKRAKLIAKIQLRMKRTTGGVEGSLYKAASAVLLPIVSGSLENVTDPSGSRHLLLILNDEPQPNHQPNKFASLKRSSSLSLQNFFSKRSFKSNPLKRTKSVTKLERKRVNVHDVNP